MTTFRIDRFNYVVQHDEHSTEDWTGYMYFYPVGPPSSWWNTPPLVYLQINDDGLKSYENHIRDMLSGICRNHESECDLGPGGLSVGMGDYAATFSVTLHGDAMAVDVIIQSGREDIFSRFVVYQTSVDGEAACLYVITDPFVPFDGTKHIRKGIAVFEDGRILPIYNDGAPRRVSNSAHFYRQILNELAEDGRLAVTSPNGGFYLLDSDKTIYMKMETPALKSVSNWDPYIHLLESRGIPYLMDDGEIIPVGLM